MNKPNYLQTVVVMLLLFIGQQSLAQSSTSWTGSVSTAWNISSNWTNGIPDSTKDVYIGDSYFTGSFQPNITVSGTCKSITIGGDVDAAFTMTRSLKAFGNVSILSNGSVIMGTSVFYVKGNWINDGNYSTTSATARVSLIGGTLQTVGGNSITNFRVLYISPSSKMVLSNDISLSGSGSLLMVYGEINPGVAPGYKVTSAVSTKVYDGGVLKVYKSIFSDNFSLSGTVSLFAGSVVDYASTDVNQTISSAYSYSTLKISGAGVKSLAANLPALYSRSALAGKIIVTAGTFDMGFYTADRGSVVVGGELSVADGATLKIAGENNFPRNFLRKSLETNSTTHYYGAYQNIAECTYGNLLISGSNNKMVTLPFTVQGDFTIQQGTLNSSSNTVTVSVAGNFVMTGGALSGTNSTYKMMGSGDQSLNLLNNVPNMIVDKTGGSVVLGADVNIEKDLTFNAGLIRTDNNYVIMAASATVTGGSQNRGWVYGNLKKLMTAGSSISKRFEIGTEDDYTPATLSFDNITVAGYINAVANINDHPELNYSGINPAKSVNRFWSFTNEGVSFDRSDITFGWSGSTMDGSASPSSFIAATFDGTDWALLNTTSRLSYSLIARNITLLSDFSVGEAIDVHTWTGDALTSDWFTPKNWLGGVPDLTSDVLITTNPMPRRYFPVVISSQTAQVHDMTIEGAATLTVNDATIQIAGNATSTGTFNVTNATVVFNGSSAQTINSGLFYNNKVKNLTISNNVTLADTDTLTGELNVAAGKTFSTNDNLTLKSDASATAHVAALPVNGSGVATAFIEGAVSIERYIPARKAWRLLGVPVKAESAPTMSGSWQEGAYGSSLLPNNNPHYGVHITGGTTLNGFDPSLTNLPSVKVYDNTLNSFVGLPQSPGTIRPISDYNGYMIYIRGDRSIDLMQGNSAAITSTTLRIRGEVRTGKQTSTVNAQNFTVLSNPYPSAINFGTITKSNVKNSFYIWDPKMGGTYGLGGYVTVSYNSGTGTYDVSSNVSGISQYIPSGEAVLIESENGSSAGTLTINESDKTTEGSDALFGRPSTTSTIRANLLAPDANGEYVLVDGSMTTYHTSASNDLTRDDISKLNGSAENISFVRKNKNLAIERRKEIVVGDTSFIGITQLKPQAYRLSIGCENIVNKGWIAMIKDKFLGTSHETVLDLKGTTNVDFTVTNDPASFAADRFYIVFVAPKAETQTAPVASNEKQVKTVAEVQPSAVVYPNPVVSQIVNFKMNGMEQGKYNVKLYSITGQLVANENITYAGKDEELVLKVNNSFVPGKYELKIEGQGKSLTTSVLKQ